MSEESKKMLGSKEKKQVSTTILSSYSIQYCWLTAATIWCSPNWLMLLCIAYECGQKTRQINQIKWVLFLGLMFLRKVFQLGSVTACSCRRGSLQLEWPWCTHFPTIEHHHLPLYLYLYLCKYIQNEFILCTTRVAMIRPLSRHKTTTWLYQDFKVSVSVLFFMKVIITKTENSNRIHLDRTRYQHKTISWFSQDCNV